MPRAVLALLLLALAAPAHALLQEQPAPAGLGPVPIEELLPGGAADAAMWAKLDETREAEVERPDGIWLVPEFPDSVKALNGQTITLTGFMIPLDVSIRRGPTHFLLGPRPPHCPFCLSVGPAQIVEVHSTAPIAATDDAITLEGRLELIDIHENGLFYRLADAQLIRKDTLSARVLAILDAQRDAAEAAASSVFDAAAPEPAEPAPAGGSEP